MILIWPSVFSGFTPFLTGPWVWPCDCSNAGELSIYVCRTEVHILPEPNAYSRVAFRGGSFGNQLRR